MNGDKLSKWADLLLDTGKRNNLINFKDSKTGTVEIVSPDFDALFTEVEYVGSLKVFDPKLSDEGDEDFLEATNTEEKNENPYGKCVSKEDYIANYEPRLKGDGDILVYNEFINPITALRSISKKAKTAIEETGVNIAYMAFGFIRWTEEENSQCFMRAPILLVPISIESDSAVDPYKIKVTDSDIIVNPTFSFKLKTDYGFELPPYDDDSVESYFAKIEKSLAKLKWTIIKECKIGIFSFLKINMYNDLKTNAAKILENSNVRTLLGEEIRDNPSQDLAEEKTVENSPLHNVVDADSSQIEAIEAACKGKSFVLQGPPGTGKSQTITNIIVECLANDKKVLFVSEKLAALNVVYDKLKKAGLEEFCLELHSYKTNKKDVIAELCHTLKTPKKTLSGRAQDKIEEKIRAQNELNEYAAELHEIRPIINKSLYSLYEEISACRKIPDTEFVITEIKSKGEAYIKEAETALAHYVQYTRSVGYDYRQNAWYGYSDLNVSYESTAQLKDDLKGVAALCCDIQELNHAATEKLAVSAKSIKQAYALQNFFDLVRSSKFIAPALLDRGVLSDALSAITSMGDFSKRILSAKQVIDDGFDEEIYKLDGSSLHKKLTKQFSGFFSRLLNKEYKSISNELKLCGKNGKRVKYKAALSIADTLRLYQENLAKFESLEEKIKPQIGSAYNGVTTDFASLIKELKTLVGILEAGVDFSSLKALTNQEFASKQDDFISLSNRFSSSFGKFKEAEERTMAKFDPREYDVRSVEIGALMKKYQSCIANIDKLDNWCEFIKVLSRLETLELKTFVDYTIDHKMATETVISAYKKAFYTQWADAMLRESPFLTRLSRISHDEIIKSFQRMDELNFEISKTYVKAKLSAQRPNLDLIAQGSAISMLLREGEKKRKQKGVRSLLTEIPGLVQTLKPCFLMSPLSVSTFLSPDTQFDVVVFDEASQIFPQDAIGAIYRGKQLIVVGDSKQMPPSNFFNVSFAQDDDESEIDDITDFESILDICAAAFPQIRLKWHYRSRFESLISFSNKNFYDDELITFPSRKQDGIGIGVDYFYVDGTFDRRTKTNRVEAEKIVNLVFDNIEKYPERSLGVIAFSVSQQNLIDNLVSKRRRQDPSKESFFKAGKAEPFFVKNLETVQGDERDTIIFSIAYGKDPQGRLLLNFGPVNRDGGERRLNVAITRAKYNIQLVSSMHYTDIDLSRTQSIGARLLREYLDYAENGEIALSRSISVKPLDHFDSEFEMEVCEFLRENGFSVDTQVGCSSFRIDMALKRPNSSEYLLAIECDGAAYHSSKNARDRDRLRQEILERMGWKFYRIWSTDWFRNKREEKERLLETAESAIESPAALPVQSEQLVAESISFEEDAAEPRFEFPRYAKADERQIAEKLNHDKLRVICAIAYLESPLSEEWLLKRIVFLFGRERITSVVRDQYCRIIKNCSYYNITRKDGFLYAQEKEIPMLRVPQEDSSSKRDIKYIALEELSLGMKETLKRNIEIEKNGLFQLLGKKLGFNRMGETIVERLEEALRLISDDIEFNGDMLSLKH